MSEQVEPVVCIAHGAFVPCRRDGEHRLTGNPYWVKAVRDYQGSSVEGLTWEPAWEKDTPAPTVREQCGQCGPGYRIGDEGCRHTPTVREGGDVAAKVITISPVEWGELIRNAQAKAWDEGLSASYVYPEPPNPYRAALAPGPHDFDNHGPTDNPDCPGCVAQETHGDQT